MKKIPGTSISTAEEMGAIPSLDLPEQKLMERETALKNRIFSFLERQGAAAYGKEGEIICDLEILTALDSKKFENINRAIDEFGDGSYLIALIKLFEGKLIFSKEDYEAKQNTNSEIEAKPLFYLPQAGHEIDLEAIKNADFYLLPSNFNSVKWDKLNKFYLQKFGITAQETEIAAKIYNKKFGAGYRDGSNQLMVKGDFNSENSNYTTVGSDWIRYVAKAKWTGETKSKSGIKTDEWSQPKVTIGLEKYQRLQESGLLTADDFKQTSGSLTSEMFRAEKNIRPRGMVYLEGAQYTFGSEFEDKKIVRLSNNLYGIVDNIKGYKKITHTFAPLSAEEIERKKYTFKERTGRDPLPANITVRKGEVEIVEFKETELNKKREDETAEEYAERVPIVAAKNFNMLQDLSHDLSQEARIGIHNLSLREQEWLASYAFSLENRYDEVVQFAKKFGLEGLKTFLACEYGEDSGDAILLISESISPKDSKEIFSGYADLIERSEEIYALLIEINKNAPEHFSVNFPQEVREAILRRSRDLLLSLSERIANKKIESHDTQKLAIAINGLNLILEVAANLNKDQNKFNIKKDTTKEGNANNHFFSIKDSSGFDYKFKIFTRAKENNDGQARVNFELNFDTENPNLELKEAFEQITLYDLDKPKSRQKKESVLRLGIDLENRSEKPSLSLDIGRSQRKSADMIRTGDIVGNLLAEYDANTGNHTTASFKTELANPDTFAAIVTAFQNYLETTS